MKTVLTLSVALLALPLLAAEPQKKAAEPAPVPAVAPAPAATPDSPLVAAAKRARAGRKKSGSIVITDATLKKSTSNVHMTTTETMRPIVLPPPDTRPSAEMEARRIADETRKATAAKDTQKKKEADARRTEQELTAARAEDDYLAETEVELDPAQPEGPTPPEQKPPHR
jgi:hypothetical protein